MGDGLREPDGLRRARRPAPAARPPGTGPPPAPPGRARRRDGSSARVSAGTPGAGGGPLPGGPCSSAGRGASRRRSGSAGSSRAAGERRYRPGVGHRLVGRARLPGRGASRRRARSGSPRPGSGPSSVPGPRSATLARRSRPRRALSAADGLLHRARRRGLPGRKGSAGAAPGDRARHVVQLAPAAGLSGLCLAGLCLSGNCLSGALPARPRPVRQLPGAGPRHGRAARRC